ncbi:MAG: hypothetical protein Q8O56_06925 [Solirubrobacteraceae bacterium]|nr:hypothetical protein [Solirubrobacteraceae bacterium]
MLLRGTGKLVAVVVLAGAAGVLLGIGLAALTGDDAPSPSASGLAAATAGSTPATPAQVTTTTTSTTAGQPGRTAAAPATTTPATISSGGRLRVDVISTIVHPVDTPAAGRRERAQTGVHVRLTNNTGSSFALAPAQLIVGDRVLLPAPPDSSSADPFPTALDADAVLDTTLRFDSEGIAAGRLAAAPVRLRIATKIIRVAPIVGSPVSGR